jgi:hypothetical protein
MGTRNQQDTVGAEKCTYNFPYRVLMDRCGKYRHRKNGLSFISAENNVKDHTLNLAAYLVDSIGN